MTSTRTMDDFVISRAVNAPLERVWRAHTEVDRLKQWWSPRDFRCVHATLDLRPGGSFHYCLQAADGAEIWGRLIYREIIPQERIVCIVTFSDKDGGLGRHPMNPSWPAQILSTTTLAEENGKTIVTVRWRPFDATEAEIRSFDDGRPDMQDGFTGTFDLLEAHLARG